MKVHLALDSRGKTPDRQHIGSAEGIADGHVEDGNLHGVKRFDPSTSPIGPGIGPGKLRLLLKQRFASRRNQQKAVLQPIEKRQIDNLS